MIVLALNCGSSSLKFQLVAVPPMRETTPIANHEVAVRRVVDWIRAGPTAFDAVGHRVVHGGERFVQPALIDATVAGAIEVLEELAPLHNGPSLAGIRACRAALGAGVPLVAVFDTAFHASLPETAFSYGIPYELAKRHGIRRFGFHGLSYQSVVSRYAELTGLDQSDVTMVALHLGNGASAAAIRHGRSVDTSMGFTPLEGLVMGTRSGDLDPALIGYLARREGVTAAELDRVLNEETRLLGLSGRTRDMRELYGACM